MKTVIKDLEDITWPHGDMKYFSTREEKFDISNGHVMLYLLYNHQ